jgi:peptidoglycan/LPS O-acetylase OafA/YrhL
MCTLTVVQPSWSHSAEQFDYSAFALLFMLAPVTSSATLNMALLSLSLSSG